MLCLHVENESAVALLLLLTWWSRLQLLEVRFTVE